MRRERIWWFVVIVFHIVIAIGTVTSVRLVIRDRDSFAVGYLCAFLTIWVFGSVLGWLTYESMTYSNRKVYSTGEHKTMDEISDSSDLDSGKHTTLDQK